MDLLRKYINIILISFVILFTNISFASSNPNVPISDCGVDSEVVKLFDGEICEQDLSFRMLYQLFPSVIENFVFPIINPKYLHLVPQLEEQNLYIYQTQEVIFFEIFKSTNKIGFFIIGIFVIWHFLFLGLIRSANDGSFLGNSWKTSSVLTKYGILIVLLFPVSDTGILVIHIVLLTILIMGIYFANYFWGVYLNYLQVGEDAIDISRTELSVVEQKTLKSEEFEKIKLRYDHNYFFAYSYAKELSLIQLCKERTEKLFVLGTMPFLTNSNVGDVNNCLINKTDSASWMQDTKDRNSTNAFIHYNNEKTSYDYTKSRNNLFITSSINFGNKDFKQCNAIDNNAFSSFEYDCGKINITTPSIPDGNIKLAIDNSNFYEQFVIASNIVMTLEDPSNQVETSWNSISNNIDLLFAKDKPLQAFKHNQSMIKKNVSFYFHRLLMNSALVGSSSYTQRIDKDLNVENVPNASFGIAGSPGFTSNEIIEKTSDFNLLMSSYMVDARKVAKKIEAIGCLENPTLYENAKNAKDLIDSYKNNTSENISSYNTSCLDVENMEIIGFDPKPYAELDNNGVALDNKINIEKIKLITSGVESLLSLTERIRLKREAIEKSFYMSIISAPSNELANRLRKEGWAVSGGYMLKLLSEKEMDNKLRHALQNSTVAKASEVSNQILPILDTQKIIKTESTDLIKEWFDLSSAIKSVLDDSTVKPSRKDLQYVDISQYLNDNVLKSMGSADIDATGQDTILDLFYNGKIIENMKSVIGIDESGELSMDQIGQCISSDPTKDVECPINLTNPIIEITQLGRNLINISSKIIVAAISVAMLEIAVMTGLKFQARRTNKATAGGDGADPASDADAKKKLEIEDNKKTSKASKVMSKAFKMLEGFSTFLHYIIKLMLGFAIFLLTVGFTLAYVIPLIPFIAFTIAFLSWIVISLEILVIAPIWLAFLFRIEDSNKPSTELYMAGFNFVMQMLFRPALIVVAITLGWSLFGVIFLMINLSMAVFMKGFDDTGLLLGFVYGMLLVTAYSLVIYVAIKQIFDLMIMLPNKIFTKVNVQPLDSSFERNAKDTLSNFTMASIGGSALMGKGLEKHLDKNMKTRKAFKEDQKTKAEDFRKAHLKELAEEKKKRESLKGNLKDE